MAKQRFKNLTPPNSGNKGTTKRIEQAKKMANLEAQAKSQGKTVAQFIVEQWS